MKATTLDLRRRMSEVLKALDRNEPVTLLHRGKRKGVLYPSRATMEERASVTQCEAFGLWRGRRDLQDVKTAARRMRRGRFHAL